MRHEDARAEDLRRLGAQVVHRDLTGLDSMHHAMEGVSHAQGSYDRMTDDFRKLTGNAPRGMREFVTRHAAAFSSGAAPG
ncbi:hypothetical protein QFZ99_005312 [Paraburkholderia atlantica]|uniref:hypothetical protein n=1 Tax=Paraburkholderia atlantica TaxID=2654982 RepID=UPI00179B37A8|nr:hypothetical protein [Paraburkholderia atlantica]